MRAPSLNATSKVSAGAGISIIIDTLQRKIFPHRRAFAIRTFARHTAMRYADGGPPGQRLIPDGNQGFVSAVSPR
jgi:hypothetical protein